MTGLGPQLEVQDQLRRLKRTTRLRQAEIVAVNPIQITLGGSDVVLEDVLVLNGGDLDVGDIVPVLAADGNILVLGSYAEGSVRTASPAGGGIWLYSTSTTMADPDVPYIRFNNATLSSVTSIAVHTEDASSINRAAWVRILDSPLGQNLTFSKIDGATIAYKITGTVTTPGGANWHQIPVEWISGSPTWVADDQLLVNSAGLQAPLALTAGVVGGVHVPTAGELTSVVTGSTNTYDALAVWVPYPMTAEGVGYWSGATAAGNVRAALYNADNTLKLADRAGTAYAASGANTFQYVAFDAAADLATPGLHWIWLSHASATNTRLCGTGMMAYGTGTVGVAAPPTTMPAIPTTPSAATPAALLVAT